MILLPTVWMKDGVKGEVETGKEKPALRYSRSSLSIHKKGNVGVSQSNDLPYNPKFIKGRDEI